MRRWPGVVSFYVGLAVFVCGLVFVDNPALLMPAVAMIGWPLMAWFEAPGQMVTPESVTPPRPDADVAQYLTAEDRAWLAEHGWTAPTIPSPTPQYYTAQQQLARIDQQLSELESRPKRSTWQTSLDRQLTSKADHIAEKVRAASPRPPNPYGVQIQTGTTAPQRRRRRPRL